MRQTLVIAAMLLVGGASGYLLAPGATPATSASRSDAALARPAPAAARGLTEADVRRVIRDELSAMPAPSAPAASSGEVRSGDDDAPAATLAPAAANALQTAHERIERALAAGEWTQGDAAVLSAALEVLPATQRAELLRALVPPLNRGELRLAYRGPLFE